MTRGLAAGRGQCDRADLGRLDARQPRRGRRPNTRAVRGAGADRPLADRVNAGHRGRGVTPVVCRSQSSTRLLAAAACRRRASWAPPAVGPGLQVVAGRALPARTGVVGRTDRRASRPSTRPTGPAMRTQKAALDRLQAEFSKLVADGRADEADRRATLISRVEAARAELGPPAALMLYRMRRILTSDQHVKLKVLFDERERERRNHGRPRPPAVKVHRFHDYRPRHCPSSVAVAVRRGRATAAARTGATRWCARPSPASRPRAPRPPHRRPPTAASRRAGVGPRAAPQRGRRDWRWRRISISPSSG